MNILKFDVPEHIQKETEESLQYYVVQVGGDKSSDLAYSKLKEHELINQDGIDKFYSLSNEEVFNLVASANRDSQLVTLTKYAVLGYYQHWLSILLQELDKEIITVSELRFLESTDYKDISEKADLEEVKLAVPHLRNLIKANQYLGLNIIFPLREKEII